jgi:rhomboid protease GluP
VPLPARWRYNLDRWRSKISGMFQSEPKQNRPRLCPACGTLVGSTASKCYQCGSNVNYSFAAASKTLSRWMPQTSPVTYAMLTICCLMYGLGLIITMKMGGGIMSGGLMGLGGIGGEVNFRLGESIPYPYIISQPWRLITAIFLHAGLLHIGFNMWVLMDIGPVVEDLYGSARYFFLYVATGAFGYLVSSTIGGHPSVGASGALLGLIGVLLAATTGRNNPAAQALRNSLIRWVIYIFVIGFIMSGTDNFAHGGGLVSGFLLGRLMIDRAPADLSEQRRANLLGWAAGIVVVISFAFMVLNYLQNA